MDYKIAPSRADGQCLACWTDGMIELPTLTSSFLSERAWGGAPEKTALLKCRECDFRYFKRGLSTSEASNYYRNYRDGEYLRSRSYHEWFYTIGLHRNLSQWMESAERSTQLSSTLAGLGFPKFQRIMDYGGDDGHLISTIRAQEKYVFDFSGAESQSGIKTITKPEDIAESGYDLIVCAQTLEHCSEPNEEMVRIVEALAPDGILYLELPNETWRGDFDLSPWKRWILERVVQFALRGGVVLKGLDLFFTGIRVKTGYLPFFGFVPMREHVNYFTQSSLERLVENFGLKLLCSQGGAIPYVVGQKKT